MVEISKHLFEQACRNVGCNDIVHPFHASCLGALRILNQKSLVGSAKFYLIVYLVQTAVRGKKMLIKEEQSKMIQCYIRSTLLGVLVANGVIILNCLLRWVQGNKISYYSYGLIPATLSGVFIYLEPLSRRGLVINLFCNLVVEYWLRTLQTKGYLALTNTKKTMMFMTGSSLLFYLMRLEGENGKRTPLLWPFTPDKVRKQSNYENPCPHDGGCLKHILKGYGIYFGAGLAITLAKLILSTPRNSLKSLSPLRIRHFNTALLFGSYIGIYRAVICYICRRRGHDSALYALPAGFLAGLSFLFNPSTGFAIASLTGAAKLFSTILYEKEILPKNIPLPEIIFCVCQGILVHARIMHPRDCPLYVYKMVTTVSGGCFDLAFNNMRDIVKEVLRKQN